MIYFPQSDIIKDKLMLNQGKFHSLKLTYQEFIKMNRNISNTQIDRYFIYKKIDNGSYGAIYLAMDQSNNQLVAAKLLDLQEINKQKEGKIRQIRKRLSITEPQLMMICNSQNIVKCYDVYENSSLKIIMMEYCNGMNLERIIESKGRIPESQAILIMRQIINGIAEMHRNRILHRDLKPANILTHNGVYKIADLGFSKQITETTNTVLGSITTMAPEVMLKQPYGTKADIWSLGVVFFQMVFGKPPYDSKSAYRMYNEIKTKKILNTKQFQYNGYTASEKVTSFLKQVLVVNPRQRLDWNQLQSHELFRDPSKLQNQFSVRASMATANPKLEIQNYNDQLSESKIFLQSEGNKDKSPKSIKNLTLPMLIQRQQQIEKSRRLQLQLYEWVRKCHLQCLKTELIHDEMFQKIAQNQLYDLQDRDIVEMIYLLLTRCLNNLSVINIKLKETNDYIVLNLKDNVSALSKKVNENWKYFSNKLMKQESKVSSIIFDTFSKIFASDTFREKDRFLIGVQGLDYTKDQQISYTERIYLSILKDKMIASSTGTKINYIKNLMKFYGAINKVTLEELSTQPFREYIEEKIFK